MVTGRRATGDVRDVGRWCLREQASGYLACMLDLRTLTRPLLAAPFIVGGIGALRAPKPSAPAADETLDKLNAGAQIVAGIALASGFFPRLASLVLSASIVPTTIAGHRFWEEDEPSQRNGQMVQFAKNAAVLSGLLATALDTGGRPSVFWSGRRAAGRAAQNVADTVTSAYQTLPLGS